MTDEELIARLRDCGNGVGSFKTKQGDYGLCDDAADRIEALVNAAALSKAAYDGVSSLLLSVQQDCIKERQRAERLEAAMSAVADDVCSYICPSIGLAGRPIPHDPRCIALRAALEPVTVPDLSDPVAVHANMLRGTIAKPTVEQIIHLYGRDALMTALVSENEVVMPRHLYWTLRSYAVHDNDCKLNKPPRFDGPCSCGLTAALEEALALITEKPHDRA